jgi:hypothetical protein
MDIVSEIVKVVAVIIMWTGGYLAAPLIFMATLGVFRNLTGMGTGSIKALSGKMRQSGREKRAWGQASRKELKQQKGTMKGARNWGNIRSFRDSTVHEAGRTGRRGLRKAGFSNVNEEGKQNKWSEFESAFHNAKSSQNDPRVQSGHLTKQAAEIEASAGAINADKTYTQTFNARVKVVGAEEARKEALESVAEELNTNIDNGSVTQSQMTGTLQFLGQQKSASALNKVQEHIASMEEGDASANKATQMYSSALGNAGTYAALTKVSPGYKAIPEAKGEAGAQNIREQRGNLVLGEAPEKVADATKNAWKDAIAVNATAAAEQAAAIQKMGGEAALKLDIPSPPATTPPATPGTDANGKTWSADEITEANNTIDFIREYRNRI